MTSPHETPSGLGDPIPRPFTNPAMHLLCRSDHFTVCSEYEYVWLEGEGMEKPVGITSFYGSPFGAAISPDEQWCVIIGYGVVVHRLRSPWWRFIPAAGERDYPWSWEMGRSPENLLVFGQVRSLEGHRFSLTVAPRQNEKSAEYVLDADIPGSLRVSHGWFDGHRTQRVEALAQLNGLRLSEVQAKEGRLMLSFGDFVRYRVDLADPCSIKVHAFGAWAPQINRKAFPGFTTLLTLVGCRLQRVHTDPDGSLSMRIDLPKEIPDAWDIPDNEPSFQGASSQLALQLAPDPPVMPRLAGARTAAVPRPLNGGYVFIRVSGSEPAGSWTIRTPMGRFISPGASGWPMTRVS